MTAIPRILRTAAAVFLIVAVAVLLQVTVAADLGLLQGYPDFVCIAALGVALLRGCELGAVTGFVSGLLLDGLAGQPLGLSAFVYCLLAYTAGRIGERFGRRAAVRPLAVIAVGTPLAPAGVLLLAFVLGQSATPGPLFSVGSVPSAALDVLFAIPAYPALRALLRLAPTPAPTPPASTSEGVSPLVV